ncbi:MAG: TraR/DksA C4-type zinc finger protein, partial [Planctomycetales bacterium]|nr:TraR/DksA C4-type zinc finger protein [Planctomycetales bacterium]
MISLQLECPDCHWWTVCGEAEIVRRLRGVGLFRRSPHPPEDLVRELLNSHAGKLTCDRCRQSGLRISETADEGDDDWVVARLCELCRQPIPSERLEFNPDARRCTECQDAADKGKSFVEPDFCPKCGSLVEVRVSKGGGITRYKLFCTGSPPCRL